MFARRLILISCNDGCPYEFSLDLSPHLPGTFTGNPDWGPLFPMISGNCQSNWCLQDVYHKEEHIIQLLLRFGMAVLSSGIAVLHRWKHINVHVYIHLVLSLLSLLMQLLYITAIILAISVGCYIHTYNHIYVYTVCRLY